MTDAAPGSPLDRWRQQRKHIADRLAEPLDLQVPGYDDPQLWARFRRLDPDEVNRIADNESVVALNADGLNAACEGLYEGHPSVGRLIAGRDAMRSPFDVLAEQLDLGATTAREACRAVFVDDYALTRAGNELARYSTKVAQQAAEEHQGE